MTWTRHHLATPDSAGLRHFPGVLCRPVRTGILQVWSSSRASGPGWQRGLLEVSQSRKRWTGSLGLPGLAESFISAHRPALFCFSNSNKASPHLPGWALLSTSPSTLLLAYTSTILSTSKGSATWGMVVTVGVALKASLSSALRNGGEGVRFPGDETTPFP